MTTATEYGQELDEQLHRLFSHTETELDVQGDSFTDMFEIVEPLGAGGEGEVYRVKDKEGTHYIAKKVSCFTNTTEHRDIEKQIQALHRLSHENIPEYVDCLVEEDTTWKKKNYYLITENVEGVTLAEKWKTLRNGDLEDICEQTLDALAHAHTEGVLHRDIKPENLIITEDGQVKVIDWGVAKIEGQQTRMSTMGVVGTAGYMAPEVIKGEKATSKSDIYSLGATVIAAARQQDHGGFDSSFEMKQYLARLKLGNFNKRLESMVEESPEKRKWEVVDGKYIDQREVVKERVETGKGNWKLVDGVYVNQKKNKKKHRKREPSLKGVFLLAAGAQIAASLAIPALGLGAIAYVPHLITYNDTTIINTGWVEVDGEEFERGVIKATTQGLSEKAIFGTRRVYKNEDSYFEWKFNSEELQQKINKLQGKKVRIQSYGFNFPDLGIYPNITAVEVMEDAEEPPVDDHQLPAEFEGTGKWAGYRGYRIEATAIRELEEKVRNNQKGVHYVDANSDGRNDIMYVFDDVLFMDKSKEKTVAWDRELDALQNPELYTNCTIKEETSERLDEFVQEHRIWLERSRNLTPEKLEEFEKIYQTTSSKWVSAQMTMNNTECKWPQQQ